MVLRREDARVLACLIDKSIRDPEGSPVTLNELRLACNQTQDRWPVVTYDDRTVESALLSLRSMGLVRFVEGAGAERPARYRHSADERWKLSAGELAVLATLVLQGPQTVDEVRSALPPAASGVPVADILDQLAARSPEPLAVRLEPREGEHEVRFAHALRGAPEDDEGAARRASRSGAAAAVAGGGGSEAGAAAGLAAEVAELRARVQRLEALLGVPSDAPHPGAR